MGYETIVYNQGSTSHNESTITHLPVSIDVNRSTLHLPSHAHPCVNQKDMRLKLNILTTDAIPTVTNERYSTSRLPSPTRPRVHQQQDVQIADAIPTATNECYSTSHLLSPTPPCVHQQQDMQLTQNQTTDIPTVTNECYSTSHLLSPTPPCVHQQQDLQSSLSQAYVNIPGTITTTLV